MQFVHGRYVSAAKANNEKNKLLAYRLTKKSDVIIIIINTSPILALIQTQFFVAIESNVGTFILDCTCTSAHLRVARIYETYKTDSHACACVSV